MPNGQPSGKNTGQDQLWKRRGTKEILSYISSPNEGPTQCTTHTRGLWKGWSTQPYPNKQIGCFNPWPQATIRQLYLCHPPFIYSLNFRKNFNRLGPSTASLVSMLISAPQFKLVFGSILVIEAAKNGSQQQTPNILSPCKLIYLEWKQSSNRQSN